MLKKKSFNIITFIAAVMLVAAFTACGGGDESDGTTSFEVYDVATLKKVGTGADGWTLSAHYKQTANIDMTGETWTAIGSYHNQFSGSYDGGGKIITGITVNAPSEDWQGLFGYIGTGGEVKNVGMVACNINGHECVGSIAGYSDGKIQNCYSTGTVTSNTSNYGGGGIVGYNDTNGTVLNCYSTGNVNGFSRVGGVAGSNDGTVQNCHSTGGITGTGGRTGGIVGYNETNGTVKNCYATGDVDSPASTGGVAGDNNGTVQDCYATGDVSGGGAIGGVVGYNDGNCGYGIVKNCYATGNVSGTDYHVGGVVGRNRWNGTIQNCYATGDISGDGNTGGVVGDNGGTVQNCYATGNISGGDDNIGGVVGANDRAVQNCYATGDITGSSNSGHVGGVVGMNTTGGTIKNCAALNKSVRTARNVINIIGRVLGYDFVSGTSNNYGRNGMTLQYSTGVTQSINAGLGSRDGADVTTANAILQTWWTTTASWDASSPWYWTNTWNYPDSLGKLPTLKGMPGNPTQNPVIKN